MLNVDISEARERFNDLLEQLTSSEMTIITKAGNPIARLTRYNDAIRDRSGGQWGRRVKIEGDSDTPLPENIAATLGATPRKGKLP